MNPDWINGLLGGAMIGAAAGLLLLGNGRIAGISGIAGGLVDSAARGVPERGGALRLLSENLLFVIGLLASPLLYMALGGSISLSITPDFGLVALAGLLVGFGARMGAGCTSGHGVCGGARGSRRSFAAMAVFMAAAMATVALGRVIS